MEERKAYIATDKAGRFVAGVRKPKSGELMLSERQAAYDLRLGNIIPKPAPEDLPQPTVTLESSEEEDPPKVPLRGGRS